MFKKIKSVLNGKEKRIAKLESEVKDLKIKSALLITKLNRLEEDSESVNKFTNTKFNKGL